MKSISEFCCNSICIILSHVATNWARNLPQLFAHEIILWWPVAGYLSLVVGMIKVTTTTEINVSLKPASRSISLNLGQSITILWVRSTSYQAL